MVIRTKQQQRAEFALKKISSIKIDEKTANFYAGAPTMILTNGLGQTMAFLLSKKEKETNKETNKESELFKILKEWLTEDKNPLANLKNKENIDFLQEFHKLSVTDYLKAQTEALRILEWFKRYAKAFEEREDDKLEANNANK
ncbi:MAG: type III-B CRISPR module-associated protein Cmr5 [Campylobacteraceae bacterium]|jgi:CRISPR-associated protein Cmr5|nr:type III-B CRISPR module-associated protein Cmr5 [Campylobacteraceae bacterium]